MLTEAEIETFYRGHAMAGILRDEVRELGTAITWLQELPSTNRPWLLI